MEFELEIIKWLQGFRNQFWDFFFQAWTMFGEELIIIAILGFTYWCLNKEIGEALGITVFLSLVVNSLIKVMIRRPRPFLVDEGIVNIRPQTSGGYAFPSGHTQGAATVFGGLGIWIKKKWLTITVSIIIVMVAISRMYLGVHYLTDVLVGLILGVGIAYGIERLFRNGGSREKMYIWILVISGVLFLASYVYYLLAVETTTEATNAFMLYTELEGLAKMIGAITGFVLGVMFEHRKVGFSNNQSIVKNIIRLVLGIGVVMAVRIALKAVFGLIVNPDNLADNQMIAATFAVIFDLLRYLGMVFIGIGIYPLVFKRIGI